jgi:hypothetical protein
MNIVFKINLLLLVLISGLFTYYGFGKINVEQSHSSYSLRYNNKNEYESIANDSDFDGISDRNEVAVFGTDPKSRDTDGDGFGDFIEIVACYNPIEKGKGKLEFFEANRWRIKSQLQPIDKPLIDIANFDVINSTCLEPNVKILPID